MLKTALLGLIIYAPTIAFVRIEVFLLLFPFVVLAIHRNYKAGSNIVQSFGGWNRNLIISLLIAMIALITRLIYWERSEGIGALFSEAYLIPLIYFASYLLFDKKVFNVILALIALEVTIAIVQYALGVTSFWTELRAFYEFPSYDLLYYTRVCGLSSNSSNFAIKILLGLFLVHQVDLNKWLKALIEFLLLIGIVLTFSRTILPITIIYLIIRVIIEWRRKSDFKHLHLAITALFCLTWMINPSWTMKQYTRSNAKIVFNRLDKDNQKEYNGIEMSGRREIWTAFGEFIKENPIIANKAQQKFIGKYHAHNAWIELYASYGLIISILYLLLITLNLNKSNLEIVLSILGSRFSAIRYFLGNVARGSVLFRILI